MSEITKIQIILRFHIYLDLAYKLGIKYSPRIASFATRADAEHFIEMNANPECEFKIIEA